MTLAQLQAYARLRQVNVERISGNYEVWHDKDHGSTHICKTIDEARMSVEELTRLHDTEPRVAFRLEMPKAAADKLQAAFDNKDPELMKILDDFNLLGLQRCITLLKPTNS